MASAIYADTEMVGEPTLEELLAEPIIKLIMKRDGVEERDMRGQIARVQHAYKTLAEAQ